MIEFEEYKGKLNGIKPALNELSTALRLDDARRELEELSAAQEQEGFWNDVEKARKNQQRSKQLQAKVDNYARLCAGWEDLYTICEMAIEENDDSMLSELQEGYASLESELEQTRLSTLLTGEYDANNAILTLHPGAGGTEAQDWASMLYRMYTRWTERHGFKYTLMDWQDGDEAGIKSATIKIEGENAYGYLKSENGVHRLVRISPFDANARRQTRFAAVEVMPEIHDDNTIEIRDEDIEMQVFRSSGAGGQKVNKTSSAVRLTH
ncbi:MAG: PCRF domain-containing protein, partial [Oscillospiraceae bacterium]|nr:PCRF domain-containing protein [Oscillospiraceae bacterium]